MSEHNDKKDELVHPLARPFLWLDAKWLKSSMIWVLGALTVFFVALDPFRTAHMPEHASPAEPLFGFYAAWGFGAFVLAVMGGWFIIRGLLGRAENYWDKEADDE